MVQLQHTKSGIIHVERLLFQGKYAIPHASYTYLSVYMNCIGDGAERAADTHKKQKQKIRKDSRRYHSPHPHLTKAEHAYSYVHKSYTATIPTPPPPPRLPEKYGVIGDWTAQ